MRLLAQMLEPTLATQPSPQQRLHYVCGVRRDDASRMFLRLRGLETELPVSRAYVHLFRAM